MAIKEQLQIVEDNLNEYGQCNITLEEFGLFKQQIRAEIIKEIALKIQKIKDNHNENPRLYPINYGTLCGICADLWEQLKEQNK